MATIDDIVKASGASRSTVFRFLNGSNVRADAKKAIIKAMEELNFKSDAVYRQQNITIEISTSTNFESFKGFTEIVQGITQRADDKGIKVQLVRRTGEQIVNDYTRWNSSEELKGVIVIGKNIADEEKEAEMLVSENIPHVFVNRVMDDPSISYVSVDLKKAAFDIVNYLIQNGHNKIAIYGNPAELRVDRDKFDGYKIAFDKNETIVSEKYLFEAKSSGDWETTIKALLESENRPSAYFGICDSHAMKFIHIAQSMGLRVPGDLSVVGMDNVESAEYFKPALTTVHIPFKKMGELAVDNLVQLITDREVGCLKTIVRHELIVRESCK